MTDEELGKANFDRRHLNTVHNWMTYVPDEYIRKWQDMSAETKRAIYDLCEERASNERWE